MFARVSSSCRLQIPVGLVLSAPPPWALAQESPDLQDGKLFVGEARQRGMTLGELGEPHSKAGVLRSPNAGRVGRDWNSFHQLSATHATT